MVQDASVMEVVAIGLESWGLLALGMGILFVVLVILNKITNKKNKD